MDMSTWYKKIGICFILFALLAQTAFAASPSSVKGIRFSQRAEAVRIVFDLDQLPAYQVKTENNGARIIIDFPATENKSRLTNLAMQDDLVKSVAFSTAPSGAMRATIDLSRVAAYKVDTLVNPVRLYIDLVKNYDQKQVSEIAPGLKHITLRRSNEKGPLTAHILDVDLQQGYRLRPVLANDKITGRETLAGMAGRHGALGAVNASYFAESGEILGLTKINSTVASATYLARSAFGLMGDSSPIIGQVVYNGTVTLPSGAVLPISGVNAERGENALVLFNPFYDATTKTNAYGKEYSIKGGKVVAVQDANSPLVQGAVVLSAHGTSATQMAGIKVGDAVQVQEDLGERWNQATQILGVGPMLVKQASVYLTTKEEAFGADVAGGRAPRTAVGITKDHHVLLMVVDGRQSHSIGCTLLELAFLMQEFGAVDAINFDGGGSSEMVIKNEIVNSPSDGGERRVGNALVILPK